MKDIGGVVGTKSNGQKDQCRMTDGQMDGQMHTRTDDGHFYAG